MNWLNIEIKTLRSHEYLGCEPIDRATWMALMTYCAVQENSGRMEDCAFWGERKWQQLVGVTKEEAERDCALWKWEGGHINVWGYPIEKEQEVKTKREMGKSTSPRKAEAARLNGQSGGRPKTQLKTERKTQQETQEKPIEGKGREGKGKEVGSVAEAPPASDEQWLASLASDSAYTGLDVPREHAKMLRWCSANGKQPTRRRFINWLNRSDKPLTTNAHQPTPAERNGRNNSSLLISAADDYRPS